MITLRTKAELEKMRRAGEIVARAHELVRSRMRPGVKTIELDRLVEDFMRSHNAVPSFKGYNGFPGSICTSINEEVVHGIPGERTLEEGQIVSVDIGAIVDGYHGDAARTWPVGEVDDAARKLMEVTAQALESGIAKVVPGNRLSDVSHAIQAYVERHGFAVVRDYVGHGIGQKMHEPPQIPNFGPPGYGPLLRPGMVLAIEPMVNAGGYAVVTKPDGWTVVTADGSLSAHFEDTVAVADGQPLILTRL